MATPLKIIILSPHPDDGILGCGGTIRRFSEENAEIQYVLFSTTDFEYCKDYSHLTLYNLFVEALQKLGIEKHHLYTHHFNTRNFDKYRQEILEILILQRTTFKPDLVFMPSSQSIHQDHKIIQQEGLRAFKHTTCYGYDLPWDTANFETSSFFKLQKKQLIKKIDALQLLKHTARNNYTNANFTESLARVRGTQINTAYAEAFEVLRTIF